jgi:deazaflavin-dependent oxidoreductase (nitroreductase family)
MLKSFQRALFRLFNRYIVVPAFQRNLGKYISNPITGNIMVIKTRGRKTGKTRYTPVYHALIGEDIYCYQGKHLKGQWYLNVLANPNVEVLLPGGTLTGVAEEVSDPKEAAYAIRQILKGSGVWAFLYGFNPFTIEDGSLEKKVQQIPVIRIKRAAK